jgi:ribosome-associated protein
MKSKKIVNEIPAQLDPLKFSKMIAEIMKSKKGFDINILDLRKLSGITDCFVICSADADRQVKAIADEIEDKLLDSRIRCLHKEGYQTMNWIILDYFDVIVHIFKADVRSYYNLEKLWGDAPITKIKNDD